MHRGITAGLMLSLALAPLMAAAQGFDVEQSTRAYLNLLHGSARARSDAYFEGGCSLQSVVSKWSYLRRCLFSRPFYCYILEKWGIERCASTYWRLLPFRSLVSCC